MCIRDSCYPRLRIIEIEKQGILTMTYYKELNIFITKYIKCIPCMYIYISISNKFVHMIRNMVCQKQFFLLLKTIIITTTTTVIIIIPAAGVPKITATSEQYPKGHQVL